MSLRILVNLGVLLPSMIQCLPLVHFRRPDRVIPQSNSTSRYRLTRHRVSIPGAIDPDQHRAWRLHAWGELPCCNLQTELVQCSWGRLLDRVARLPRVTRAHHLRVLLAYGHSDVRALLHPAVLVVCKPARSETRGNSRTSAEHHGLCSC